MAFLETLRARFTRKSRKNKRQRRMLALSKYPIFELSALERRILLSSLYRVYYGFDDNNTDGWSTLAVENYAYGSSGQKYLAGPSTLTLSGLPAHTGAVVSLTFALSPPNPHYFAPIWESKAKVSTTRG